MLRKQRLQFRKQILHFRLVRNGCALAKFSDSILDRPDVHHLTIIS